MARNYAPAAGAYLEAQIEIAATNHAEMEATVRRALEDPVGFLMNAFDHAERSNEPWTRANARAHPCRIIYNAMARAAEEQIGIRIGAYRHPPEEPEMEETRAMSNPERPLDAPRHPNGQEDLEGPRYKCRFEAPRGCKRFIETDDPAYAQALARRLGADVDDRYYGRDNLNDDDLQVEIDIEDEATAAGADLQQIEHRRSHGGLAGTLTDHEEKQIRGEQAALREWEG